MTYKRKWLPGEVIHTMNELISQGTGSNNIVFWRGKPYSMGWILSMQAHTIITYLERGDFRRAVPADGNKGANLMYSTQNKEFAGIIKDKWFDNRYDSPDVDFDDFISNLLKEMVGEKK